MRTLEEIAFLTGGAINPKRAEIAGQKRIAENADHLFMPLVLGALALIIIGAFVREIGVLAMLRLLFWRSDGSQSQKVKQGFYHDASRRRV